MDVIEYLFAKATADCIQMFLHSIREMALPPQEDEPVFLPQAPPRVMRQKEIEIKMVPRFFIEEKERDLWKKHLGRTKLSP